MASQHFESEKCALCGTCSNFVCQKCLEPYCSVVCQMKDWPQHKLMCIPIPQLIPKQSIKMVNKKQFLVQGRTESISSENLCSIKHRPLRENSDNMRRPRIETVRVDSLVEAVPTTDQVFTKIDNLDINEKNYNNEDIKNVSFNRSIESISKNDGIKNQNQFRNKNNLSNIQENIIVNNKANINDRLTKFREGKLIEHKNTEDNTTKLMKNPGFEKDYGIIHHSPSSDLSQSQISGKCNVNVKPWKIPFPFPDNKSSFKAMVQFVKTSDKLMWLTDITLESKSTNLLKQINTNIQHAQKATINDINIDDIVSVPFTDGLHYRAIILDNVNTNNEVRVRLIDYGNDFLINIDQLKLPIPIMKNLHSYAFCCRYDKPTEIGKILNIRIIGKESDEIFEIEEIDNTVLKLEKCSILKLLPIPFKIIIMNIFNEKSNAFAVVLNKIKEIDLEKLNDLLLSEETFQYDFNITDKPKNGNLIAARTKEWKRGIIIDQFNDKYLIFFIDSSEIEIVQQIKILPKQFTKIPPLTLLIDINKICIDEESFHNQYFCNLNIFTIKKTDNLTSELKMNCELYNDNNEKLAKITINHFNGDLKMIQNLKMWQIPPTNDDIVVITRIIDNANIYITLKSIQDYYSYIFNEIVNLNILKNEKIPKINEIYLIKNSNEYQRCCIINKIDEKQFLVQNIDSGCEFIINSDNIKIANDFIKFLPVYATKCSLDIVNVFMPKASINNKAVQILKNYCTVRQEFVLKFNKNFVELFFNDAIRKSMNKEIIPFLFENNDNSNFIEEKCTTENEADVEKNIKQDEKLYNMDDIELTPIKTGDNIKILILDCSNLKNSTITASAFDTEFIQKYYGEYQLKMNDYCASNNEYSPNQNELCFTLYEYDEQWYRSLCLQKMPNEKFLVNFVDFGNVETVKKSQIRKFHKDFLFKRIANNCLVDGLPPTLTDEQINKLSLILHSNAAIVVDKVEFVNDAYLIYIDGIAD